jgi:two-component system, cell cycle response regulator
VARAPVVLIVCEHEWFSRSLGTILAPRGYAVLRAYNGRQALERSAGSNPDAVFIDRNLSDMQGAELCRKLLDQDLVSRSAAIIMLATAPVSREERLRGLEAGAWDMLTLPLDAEELILRVDRYIRGKLESDRLREEALIDPSTGLYSWHGIAQRVRELGAAAERFGRPLACIVFTSGPEEDAEAGDEAGDSALDVAVVADLLRSTTRKSDVLARIGPKEFAVVTPDTTPAGARRLVERLREQSIAGSPDDASRFRAGIYAVENLRETKLDPLELVLRATAASRVHHTN